MKDDSAGSKLLSIGRFSQMTRLSIKGLRLYAEKGLLEPASIDESNGYRYYHSSQAGRAEAIRGLRAAEMPLEPIRLVLDAGPGTANRQLAAHGDSLLQMAEKAHRAAGVLTEIIEGKRPLVPYELTTKTLPGGQIASVERDVDHETVADSIEEGFGRIIHALGEAGCSPTGAPYIVFHDVIDEETSGMIELCVPTVPEFGGRDGVTGRWADPIDVVATVHRGRYSDIGPAYHALSGWMETHDREPAGPPRESYLNDPREVGEGEQLTEVAWPISDGAES